MCYELSIGRGTFFRGADFLQDTLHVRTENRRDDSGGRIRSKTEMKQKLFTNA